MDPLDFPLIVAGFSVSSLGFVKVEIIGKVLVAVYSSIFLVKARSSSQRHASIFRRPGHRIQNLGLKRVYRARHTAVTALVVLRSS